MVKTYIMSLGDIMSLGETNIFLSVEEIKSSSWKFFEVYKFSLDSTNKKLQPDRLA